MNTIEKLIGYFYSGQAGLVLTSVEPEECLRELAEAARATQGTDEPYELAFWDCADGLTDMYGNQMTIGEGDVPDEDLAALGLSNGQSQKIGLHETLETVLGTARQRQYREETGEMNEGDDTMRILVIRNFDRHLAPSGMQGPVDAALLMLVQKIVNEGQGTKVFLIMQTTPGFDLPDELTVHCEYVEHDLPESEERLAIIADLGVEEEHMSKKVLDATAGLSRAKTAQYAAETIATHGYLNPMSVFKKKALHLGRSSKLAVWSPEFVERVKLWPSPDVEDLADANDVNMIHEETHASNRELGEDEVRVKLSYIEGSKSVERWLDPMPKDKFETLYRPDRSFYSFKSVIGLDGLKEFLSNGFRPNVPLRARLKHILMLGVPGTGKSHMMRCTSGEFGEPTCEMQVDKLYSKWLGDTDKILARMLSTAGMIGGILAIDEFQRFLPKSGGDGGEGSGVENRMGGSILTWLNDQNSNLVMSAANNISNLPDEFTRSGRCDVTMFVGFPGKEAKEAAWKMYIRLHELENQALPADEYWTPADIMNCCRLAEQQREPLTRAARFVTPSYEKNRKQMDELMEWAETAGCVCAETGERFVHPRKVKAASSTPKKVTRKVRQGKKESDG